MLPAEGLAGAAWFTNACVFDVMLRAFSVPLLSPAVPLPTARIAAAVRENPASVAPMVNGPGVVIPALPPTVITSLVVLVNAAMSAELALFRNAMAVSPVDTRRTPVVAGLALALVNGALAVAIRQLPPELL